jgi:anti-sigma regulatory factor (Ser/Thr protein kinase)
MLAGASPIDTHEVDVSDRIVLTMPTATRFRSVATLVLGGIGSRLDFPYERTDDLQLAVLSALDASDDETVTLEVDADERGLRLALGPVRNGSSEDDGLVRVLSRLVDDVAHESRDGGEWLTLGITRRAP